ncbi:MAG: hypothetical protein KKD28_02950 [Chloroflexi bacterium]|nr:hypothetical protein [Chloroflexota bacterium]
MMNTARKPRILKSLLLLLLLAWGAVACQSSQTDGDASETQALPTQLSTQSLPPEYVRSQGQQISQWVVEAEASSEYSSPEWAAEQAIGAPDTHRCGDYQTAWASASSDSIVWLEVKFPLAVYVTAVNISQSFNPNQVVAVELVGQFGRSIEIYNQPPAQVNQPCPYTLPISIDKTKGRFDTVRITIDQSVLGLGWNQIDAVELVGEAD